MSRSTRVASILCGGLALAADNLQASSEKPLWEVGLGVAALSVPVYRGADQRRDFLLPLPYLIYRGETFKADRRGVRSELVEHGRLELDIAADASPPVGSGVIEARRGMPDLRATLGVGPALDYLAWASGDGLRELRLQLPVVGSFTLESRSSFVGWQATPRLNFDIENPFGSGEWRLGVLAGLVYGSRDQHAYFYRVSADQATSTRGAYSATGGYAGSELLFSLSRRFPSWWIGAFARHDNLRGAVMAESPLVRRTAYSSVGIAAAWMIGESAQRVRADD